MDRAAEGTRWIFVSYLALIVWVPIPLGSNRPWAWALMEFWVFALALWWLAGVIRGRHACPPVLRDAWPMLACGLAWLAFVWFQLLPLPMGLLEWLSPVAARWHVAAAAPDAITSAPLTLDRYAGVESVFKSTAYIAFFALSLVLLGSRDRIRIATYVVAISGLLQAWYGAVATLRNFNDAASGTFVNRNHFAAYLVMCLSVGIGVLVASLTGKKNDTWGGFFHSAIKWMISPKMALRLVLLVMVIALVLTRSRMGNSSFFISLLVAGVIGLALSRRATRSMVILLVSLIAIDLFVVGTYFGTQRVVERIAQTSVETEDREQVAGYALDMWKDFPVFGSGLGSFPAVFPRYSKEATIGTYTHAHNDYVEFAAETGLIGFALLALMVTMSFAVALRAHYLRGDPVMRGTSFAAMMGIIALMMHSTVDFNLQIPANALTFMFVLALAWVSGQREGAEA